MSRSGAHSGVNRLSAAECRTTIIGGAKDEAVSAGFASMLAFVGLGEEESASKEQVEKLDERVQRVEAAIEKVDAAVNETKRNVDAARVDVAAIKDITLRNAYSAPADAAATQIRQIDHALVEIGAANRAPAGERGNKRRADVETYLANTIALAPETLRDVVFGNARGAGGTPLIQAAFDVAAGNGRRARRRSARCTRRTPEAASPAPTTGRRPSRCASTDPREGAAAARSASARRAPTSSR